MQQARMRAAKECASRDRQWLKRIYWAQQRCQRPRSDANREGATGGLQGGRQLAWPGSRFPPRWKCFRQIEGEWVSRWFREKTS